MPLLKNLHCVPDEIKPPENTFILFIFMYMYISLEREKRRNLPLMPLEIKS